MFNLEQVVEAIREYLDDVSFDFDDEIEYSEE